MTIDRSQLFDDTTVRGSAWCREHCAAIDGWIRSLFVAAAGDRSAGVALVATGGYGRTELCPHSDIDVMLLHARSLDVSPIADRIWYPIWDTGIHLGHSVATPQQALALAADDLDTATALLDVRLVAGDPRLAEELADGARRQWRGSAKRRLTELGVRMHERHVAAGDVAFDLEPDLKDGRGGLRDVQSLHWADIARPVLDQNDRDALAAAYESLLAIRVELQRHTDRATNAVVLEDRDAIAVSLGLADGDEVMSRIAEAGRAIAWRSDDVWRRVALDLRGPLSRRRRRVQRLAAGMELRDGEVHVTSDAAAGSPSVLDVARHAAQANAVLSRSALERLASDARPQPAWTAEARDTFVQLLLAGRRAVPVIEALDQAGVWSTCVLPEWASVHAHPQHNPYHRYTVDRHLLEAVAHAAELAGQVDRPDLLVLAALLHDLGKGQPGDHTAAGVELARSIGTRLGLGSDDVDVLTALVAHHLLLVDVATRRDLDDPATAQRVADVVGTPEQLRLLAALTEADARATGPSAWTPWKADLVAQLVDRVEHVLAVGAPRPGDVSSSAQLLTSVDPDRRDIVAAGDTITVVADDRPGTFSRIAGVLALHGLEVFAADAVSTDGGAAVSQFRVSDPLRGDPPWDRVTRDVELALDGRLAITARLHERALRYRRGQPARHAADTQVHFDDASDATVIDVHTADAAGVLYRITRALADLDLDIRSAKVQTIGHDVVDAFYVRDRHGHKIDDDATRREIVHAIRHELAR